MTRKTRRRLLLVVGLLLGLAVVGVLVLPLLVDVNQFRPTIEKAAQEALGRPVKLGEMRLSLFPSPGIQIQDLVIGGLPEEGGGDLLTAARLQVGARLRPLLHRELQVTSLILEKPSLVLTRGQTGTWNIMQLLAGSSEPQPETSTNSASGEFSIARLHLRHGRIEVRDAALVSGHTLQAVISDLDLDLSDLAPQSSLKFKLQASLEGKKAAKIRAQGEVGPLRRATGEAMRLSGQLSLEDLDPVALADWISALAGPGLAPPGGLLGEGTLQMAGEFQAKLGGSEAVQLELTHVVLGGLQIRLRHDRAGRWNVQELLPEASTAGKKNPTAFNVSLDGLELHDAALLLHDESGPGGPLEMALKPLTLHLDHLPLRGAARMDLKTELVSGKSRSPISVGGSVGPFPAGDGNYPVDLKVTVSHLAPQLLRPFLPGFPELPEPDAQVSLEASLSGPLPSRLDTAGQLELGSLKTIFDIGVTGSGAHLKIRSFELGRGETLLSARGKVDHLPAGTNLDVTLKPSRIATSDLKEIMALAGTDLPVELAAARPLELQGHFWGPVSQTQLPAMEGSLTVHDLRFHHASLAHDLESVDGTVSLHGETIKVEHLSARMGPSDLAGDITINGFHRPHVKFKIKSRQADFWDLMSFVSDQVSDAPAAPAAAGTAPPVLSLDNMQASGTLDIEKGSFGTLQFHDLSAGLKLQGQKMVLNPFKMDLYQGTFKGTAHLDVGASPVSFTLASDLQNVDVGALLAGNLDLTDVLDGRLDAQLKTSGSGNDYAAIVQSLAGGGAIALHQGRIGRLDVLGVLSKATGVFGEQSLNRLSSKLEKEGTEFASFSGHLALAQGKLESQDLVLKSPDIDLSGNLSLSLLAGTLKSHLRIIFSDALSRSMQAEGSRAASLFWNDRHGRVELPLELSGPVTAPVPGINWGAATHQLVTRKGKEKLRSRLPGSLAKLFGGRSRKQAPPPAGASPAGPTTTQQPGLTPASPAADTATSAAPEALPPAPATATHATPPNPQGAVQPAPPTPVASDLVIAITRAHWSGSLLMRNLKISGTVTGSRLAQARLVVTDASGKTMQATTIGDVDRYFASGADRALKATVPWNITIKGKHLFRGRSPFTIKVTAVNTTGEEISTSQEIKK